jgi:hypothetical protein
MSNILKFISSEIVLAFFIKFSKSLDQQSGIPESEKENKDYEITEHRQHKVEFGMTI